MIDFKFSLDKFTRWITYILFRLLFGNKTVTLPIDASKIKKILILRYDAIGDMIVTLPSISVLKRHLYNTEIHVLASNRNDSIVRHDIKISKIFILEKGFAGIFRTIKKLRKERYDLIFSLVFNKTSFAAIIANLAGYKKTIKISVAHETRNKLYSSYFNVLLPIEIYRNKMTMAEIQSRMICTTFGINYNPLMLDASISIPEDRVFKASEFFSNYPDTKFICLNISAGNPDRKWDLQKNIDFINTIAGLLPDVKVQLICSPEDVNDAIEICNGCSDRAVLFPPGKDVLDTCEALKYMDAVVTPDTSIVHAAACAGKPVLVLYSLKTSFIREWMPFKVDYRCVSTLERQPVSEIKVVDVVKAFRDLIGKDK
jgi:ADP-heptose:LPS heptosyltransferase